MASQQGGLVFEKFKNIFKSKQLLMALIIANVAVVFFAVEPVRSKFESIDIKTLDPKITKEKERYQALVAELESFDPAYNIQNYSLDNQFIKLQLIIWSIDNTIKINSYGTNHQGRLYALTGINNPILFLAHEIKQLIDDVMLMADVRAISIFEKNAVIELQIYGVDNDE